MFHISTIEVLSHLIFITVTGTKKRIFSSISKTEEILKFHLSNNLKEDALRSFENFQMFGGCKSVEVWQNYSRKFRQNQS